MKSRGLRKSQSQEVEPLELRGSTSKFAKGFFSGLII